MVRTVLLLIASNVFMTLAWYGHLKFREKPLMLAILASWLIALPEYALQVPANRFGFGELTATQLKIIQEVVSLSAFAVFAWAYFGEASTWRTGLAFVLVLGAVALVGGRGEGPKPADQPPDEAAASNPRATRI